MVDLTGCPYEIKYIKDFFIEEYKKVLAHGKYIFYEQELLWNYKTAYLSILLAEQISTTPLSLYTHRKLIQLLFHTPTFPELLNAWCKSTIAPILHATSCKRPIQHRNTLKGNPFDAEWKPGRVKFNRTNKSRWNIFKPVRF